MYLCALIRILFIMIYDWILFEIQILCVAPEMQNADVKTF